MPALGRSPRRPRAATRAITAAHQQRNNRSLWAGRAGPRLASIRLRTLSRGTPGPDHASASRRASPPPGCRNACLSCLAMKLSFEAVAKKFGGLRVIDDFTHEFAEGEL